MEAAREKGNAAFKAKRYAEAREQYTAAIELSASGTAGDGSVGAKHGAAAVEFVAPCFANRTLVLLKMELLPDALEDADRGLAKVDAAPPAVQDVLRPIASKLHFRKGLALRGLGRLEEALRAYQAAAAAAAAAGAEGAGSGPSKAVAKETADVMKELAASGSSCGEQQAGPHRDFSKPTPSSLGSDFLRFMYRASPDGADTSLLILLHGLYNRVHIHHPARRRPRAPPHTHPECHVPHAQPYRWQPVLRLLT